MSETTTHSFFDEIVAASGLSPVIAPFTISRLLLRVGVRDDVGPAELERALDEIERGLRVYLSDEDVAAAMKRLSQLAGTGR